uniref:Uncharacterized protein n=1 Tax=Anguilla anguilla TaxID=7936 RepID=A0A0E9UL97_ANGAN
MEFDRRLRRVPVLELREKLGGFFFPRSGSWHRNTSSLCVLISRVLKPQGSAIRHWQSNVHKKWETCHNTIYEGSDFSLIQGKAGCLVLY